MEPVYRKAPRYYDWGGEPVSSLINQAHTSLLALHIDSVQDGIGSTADQRGPQCVQLRLIFRKHTARGSSAQSMRIADGGRQAPKDKVWLFLKLTFSELFCYLATNALERTVQLSQF